MSGPAPQPSYDPKPIDDMSEEELALLWSHNAPVNVLPWTEDLALRAARVDRTRSREDQLAQIRDSIDADDLPEQAVDALIDAGWIELDDPMEYASDSGFDDEEDWEGPPAVESEPVLPAASAEMSAESLAEALGKMTISPNVTVNVQAPAPTRKIVKRDARGLIESIVEVPDDEEDDPNAG